jgi:hypothetical protein
MYTIPQPRESTEYFALNGGLLETIPALNVSPGSLRDVINYEPAINGGYRRVAGYERFDGRDRPSDADYTAIKCTLIGGEYVILRGDLVTIGAATGIFVSEIDGGCLLTKITGTVPASTDMTIGAGVVAGATGSPALLTSYAPNQEQRAENLAAASDALRSKIQEVGSLAGATGPVRGVAMLKGDVYAWRNNDTNTACIMHKATSGGWAAVTLADEVSFTNANTSVGVGDTLTQGAVTATIRKVVVKTGTLLSGTNTGKLVISGTSGGSFTAAAATSTGGGSLTLSGAQVAQAFPAGGKYDFDEGNFTGATDSLALYGANGVGRAFEWDGTYLTWIDTGNASDTPKHVAVHRNMLFLSQGSSVFNSSIGDPGRFVTAEGASETAVGDDVTGMAVMAGEALAICTKNAVRALVGASSSEWSLQTVSPDNGANEWTLQNLDQTYAMDDIGVTRVQPTDQYGNFSARAESASIQPSVVGYRNRAVCSALSRSNFLYRVFMNNGQVLVGMPGKAMSFTKLQFLVQANVAMSGEDNNGNERNFIGCTDGYVYELDRGSSFDGEKIRSYVTLWFNHSRSPRLRKRYKRITFECSAAIFSRVEVRGELTFDDGTTQATSEQYIEIRGSGGVWGNMLFPRYSGIFDNDIFDNGIFDVSLQTTVPVAQPRVDTTGQGVNIGVRVYSDTRVDFGHAIQGVTLHFIPRRGER